MVLTHLRPHQPLFICHVKLFPACSSPCWVVGLTSSVIHLTHAKTKQAVIECDQVSNCETVSAHWHRFVWNWYARHFYEQVPQYIYDFNNMKAIYFFSDLPLLSQLPSSCRPLALLVSRSLPTTVQKENGWPRWAHIICLPGQSHMFLI